MRIGSITIMIDHKTKYHSTMILFETWIHSILKNCESCGKFNSSVKIEHRNTAYTDDYRNYISFCDDCRKMDDEMYQEMWDDYNSSRI